MGNIITLPPGGKIEKKRVLPPRNGQRRFKVTVTVILLLSIQGIFMAILQLIEKIYCMRYGIKRSKLFVNSRSVHHSAFKQACKKSGKFPRSPGIYGQKTLTRIA